MVKSGDVNDWPLPEKVIESMSDPTALVRLGNSAVAHVIGKYYGYDRKWSERLWLAVATLKDAIESNTRINSAVAELAWILLYPPVLVLSRGEAAGLEEPTEEEIEAWAWGADLAKISRWLVASVVLGVSAILSFSVITFALESPGSLTTIVFFFLGAVLLSGATFALGAGLYQLYVVRGDVSWKENRGYPDAEVKRQKNFYQTGGWYAYIMGGFFLALSVAFAIIVGKELIGSVMPDYTIMRVALLASMALGLSLFAIGAWPIIRNVVAKSEMDRRMGKAKYMASPRLLLAILPILTGTLSLLINWLFR